MISMGIAAVCFVLAINAFQIGSRLSYVLCAVSVAVGCIMLFNGMRVRKEKNENKAIALKAQSQLLEFIGEYDFHPDSNGSIDFNKPFMLFDRVSGQLLCGMPLSECALIPFSKLLGVRLYSKAETEIETDGFSDLLFEKMDIDEEESGLYMPKSKGVEFMFLMDDKETPIHEFEFIDAMYPKNSYYYRDEIKRAKAYMERIKDIVCDEYEKSDDDEIAFWKFEE